MRGQHTIPLLLVVALLSGCAAFSPPQTTPTPPPSNTPRATQTPVPMTQVAFERTTLQDVPQQRLTLPPTWTPTTTFTPLPPTLTRTPTVTPSPTPTLTAADICAGLSLSSSYDDGGTVGWDKKIALVAFSEARSSVDVSLTFTHRLSNEGVGYNAALSPTAPFFALEIDAESLERPGLYDWSLVIDDPQYGEICAQSGYFVLGRPEWVTPTPTVSPAVIIVTATPDN